MSQNPTFSDGFFYFPGVSKAGICPFEKGKKKKTCPTSGYNLMLWHGRVTIQDEIMGVKVQEIKEEIKAPTEEIKDNKKIEFKVDINSLF